MNTSELQSIVDSKESIIKELDEALAPYKPLADIRECLAAANESNKYEILGVIVSAQAALNEFKVKQKENTPVTVIEPTTGIRTGQVVRRVIRTRKNALDTETEVMNVVKNSTNGINIREVAEKMGIGVGYVSTILRQLMLDGKLQRYENAHDTGRPVYVYRQQYETEREASK